MTARERVLAAINHEPCDRVATDLWLTPEVTQDLLRHFDTEDWGVVMAELGAQECGAPGLRPHRADPGTLSQHPVGHPGGERAGAV